MMMMMMKMKKIMEVVKRKMLRIDPLSSDTAPVEDYHNSFASPNQRMGRRCGSAGVGRAPS